MGALRARARADLGPEQVAQARAPAGRAQEDIPVGDTRGAAADIRAGRAEGIQAGPEEAGTVPADSQEAAGPGDNQVAVRSLLRRAGVAGAEAAVRRRDSQWWPRARPRRQRRRRGTASGESDSRKPPRRAKFAHGKSRLEARLASPEGT